MNHLCLPCYPCLMFYHTARLPSSVFLPLLSPPTTPSSSLHTHTHTPHRPGAHCKIIGLTLETRPDTINLGSIREFRRLGCTRLQLGIQHTDNVILEKTNRGHGIEEGNAALTLLRDCCYKVDIHLMPDLPGATVEGDRAMFGSLLGVKDMKRLSVKETDTGCTEDGNHYVYELEDDQMQASVRWRYYVAGRLGWSGIILCSVCNHSSPHVRIYRRTTLTRYNVIRFPMPPLPSLSLPRRTSGRFIRARSPRGRSSRSGTRRGRTRRTPMRTTGKN